MKIYKLRRFINENMQKSYALWIAKIPYTLDRHGMPHAIEYSNKRNTETGGKYEVLNRSQDKNSTSINVRIK
jgi:hypothetical protein